jgi:hypothetical protein
MSTNLTSTSPLLRPNDRGAAVDLLFRQTDFVRWAMSRGLFVENTGGSPHAWNVQTASGGLAEIFVEGQAIGLPGTPAFSTHSVAATYLRGTARVTGHVRDQIARGGMYEDAAAKAVSDATLDLLKKTEDTLVGSTQDAGIAAIIDSTTVYGGLDPAVVTETASLETAVGGALTVAVLDTHYRTLSDSPRGAMPDTILCGLRQRELYARISGTTSGAGLPNDFRANAGSPYDYGIVGSVAFNGIPFTVIRLLTASELYMLDVASGMEIRMQRNLQAEITREADDTVYTVSHAYLPVVRNRRKQGKLTGLST